MTNNIMIREDLILSKKGYYMIGPEMTPTRNHQVWEELLEKEKDLGAMLRLQRDKEGRFP